MCDMTHKEPRENKFCFGTTKSIFCNNLFLFFLIKYFDLLLSIIVSERCAHWSPTYCQNINTRHPLFFFQSKVKWMTLNFIPLCPLFPVWLHRARMHRHTVSINAKRFSRFYFVCCEHTSYCHEEVGIIW